MNISTIILTLSSLLIVSCADPSSYRDYENGYYIMTENNNLSYFCKGYYLNSSGLVGKYCKDMTCKLAANKLATIERVVVKEGVAIKTENFQYKNISCGGK